MSRSLSAPRTSERCQKLDGISGGSNALARMGMSFRKQSRGRRDTVRLEAYAINSLGNPQLRWVRGGILSIVGCMQARNASTSPCPACGGRGWKFSRSRRGWVTGTLNRSQTACVRRSCMECRGSGQLTALGGPDS